MELTPAKRWNKMDLPSCTNPLIEQYFQQRDRWPVRQCTWRLFPQKHSLSSAPAALTITGLPANAPILPNPRTAVPLEMTATKLLRCLKVRCDERTSRRTTATHPRPVYFHAASGSLAISRQGSATPGLYASARSCAVAHGLVGIIFSLPAGSRAWYTRASCSKSLAPSGWGLEASMAAILCAN